MASFVSRVLLGLVADTRGIRVQEISRRAVGVGRRITLLVAVSGPGTPCRTRRKTLAIGTVTRFVNVTKIRTCAIDITAKESTKTSTSATERTGIATRGHAMVKRPDHFVAENVLPDTGITEVFLAKLLVSRET